jgi:hypothetical protein
VVAMKKGNALWLTSKEQKRRRYDGHMSQVVIELPDDDASELVEAARRARTTPERLAAEAVHTYLHPRRQLSFVALGASGTHDTAARIEEILRDELDS